MDFDVDGIDFSQFDGDGSKPPRKMSPIMVVAAEPVKKKLRRRNFKSFIGVYNSENNITFIIKGLLPSKGLMYVGARSGTGKTILAIQFAVDLVLGRNTMTFQRDEEIPPQKIGILSLEMGEEELKVRLRDMYPKLTDEQHKILDESIMVYSDPESWKLWKAEDALDLYTAIVEEKFTGLIIDSASVSFADSLKNDEEVNKTIETLYRIRNRLNVWNIIVCHTRKLPAGIVANLEDVTVDEIFGHSGVAQSASSVLLMHHDKKEKPKNEGEKVVYLMNPKSRFGPEFAPFKMVLKPNPLQFTRDAIPLQPLTEERRREINKTITHDDIAGAVQGIDFSRMKLGDEE